MRKALEQAEYARSQNEVPIGAVIVSDGLVIGKGYNMTERLHDVTAHAEILAITAAAENLGAKYLWGCTLFVTIEPCIMCAGALYWSQIDRIVFGARDEKRGFMNVNQKTLHPRTTIISGVLEEDCRNLVKDFFKNKRR